MLRPPLERLGFGVLAGLGVLAGVVDAVVTGGAVRFGAALPLPQPATPAASNAARIGYRRAKPPANQTRRRRCSAAIAAASAPHAIAALDRGRRAASRRRPARSGADRQRGEQT